MLAGVKGLGATKVNSLLDAFNKPFMVGGLKRADGTVRPATDLAASKTMPATGRIAKQGGRDAPLPTSANHSSADRSAEVVTDERVESPEWPSDVEDEEEEQTIGRGREKVPSRSPPPATGNGEVWHDPLDDGDENESDDGEEPPTKRAREEQ